MTTLDCLLANILANPECDTARLVYADALQDRDGPGDAERGEFIRVQCELARTDEWKVLSASSEETRRNSRHGELCTRSHELFASSGPLWWNELPGQWRATVGSDKIETADGIEYRIRRGFVAEVRGPMATLRGGPCKRCVGYRFTAFNQNLKCRICNNTGRTPGVLAALANRQPVETVKTELLSDDIDDGSRCWISDRPNLTGLGRVPKEVFDLLDGGWLESGGNEWSARFGYEDFWRVYRNEAAANAALSRALVAEAGFLASATAARTEARR